MNMNHVEQIKDFTVWAKKLTGKSTKFSMCFWSHSFNDETKPEYSLYIEDLFNYSTHDLRALIALLPYLNQLCNENKLPKEPARLVA